MLHQQIINFACGGISVNSFTIHLRNLRIRNAYLLCLLAVYCFRLPSPNGLLRASLQPLRCLRMCYRRRHRGDYVPGIKLLVRLRG